MSHINKDISLSKINIPGSHDAMTKNVDLLPFVASTQAYSIEEQLNAGIRYFDIRVVTDPNNTNR
jgi:1-phosphatidylinositol phosphodiesterase